MLDNGMGWALLVFFLLGITLILVSSLRGRKAKRSHADYMVGGRSFSRFFVGLGAAAASNSGAVMIASVGLGYTQGISAILMPIGFMIGELTFWLFFPERANRIARDRNCFTVPQLVSSPFPENARESIRKIATIFTVIIVGLFGAAQFYAAGVALDGVFDIGLTLGVVISASIILAYSAIGGVQSSVLIGSILAVVMVLGTVSVLMTTIVLGGGVSSTLNDLAAIDPSLVTIGSVLTILGVIGFIMGFAFSGFGFGLSAPHLLVRFFSGKNQKEVRSARWIYLGVTYTIWMSTTLFGVVCRALLPDIHNPEEALLTFSVQYLDPLLVGCVIFMVFGAIASTADSQLLVFSSAIGVDLLPKTYQYMTSKIGNWYRVILTVISAILFTVLACQFTRVIDLMLFVIAAMPATFAAVMLVVLLKLKTSRLAIIAAMISGFLTSVIWNMLGFNFWINGALPGFISSLLVHFLFVNLYTGSIVSEIEPQSVSDI